MTLLNRIVRGSKLTENEESSGNSDDSRVAMVYLGTCYPEACKGETACKSINSTTYTCICTHDSQPPTSKGTCPRKLVQNIQSGRIPNVQPPSNKFPTKPISHNNSRLPTVSPTTVLEHPSMANFLVPALALVAGCLLLFSAVFFMKMKSRKRQQRSVVNLKHSILMPDRYVPNPQYHTACAATGVPVLKKETLRFLNELGEGCFGKVFKENITNRSLVACNKNEPQKEARYVMLAIFSV